MRIKPCLKRPSKVDMLTCFLRGRKNRVGLVKLLLDMHTAVLSPSRQQNIGARNRTAVSKTLLLKPCKQTMYMYRIKCYMGQDGGVLSLTRTYSLQFLIDNRNVNKL